MKLLRATVKTEKVILSATEAITTLILRPTTTATTITATTITTTAKVISREMK